MQNKGMNFEQILQFIIAHNATIIETLIAAILVTVLFLALRAFLFGSDGPEENSRTSMVELEATLKKLIEQAGKVPLTVVPEREAAAAAASGGDLGSATQAAQLSEQINSLRKELETKQKEIEEIRTSAGGAAGASAAPLAGMSDADKSKLEEQIKDLQAKLQEYEIISEDIADLSFYKEQNAKLQKELEAVKGGAPTPVTPEAPPSVAPKAEPSAEPAAAAPVEPAAVPAKEEPEIVGKASSAKEAAAPAEAAPAATEPAAEPAAATTATEPVPPVENVVDDQLMAEFAAAVQKQGGGAAAPATAPASEKAADPATPKASADFNLGEVDIEKMVQEAGGISGDGPEVTAEQALGTGIDAEKLLQEATALQGVNPEEKKLMGDFESFVKKNEG
jgi:hypothetical protein